MSIIGIVGKKRIKLCDIIHTPAFSMKYIIRDNDISESIDNMITLDNDTIITIRERVNNNKVKIINNDVDENNTIELEDLDNEYYDNDKIKNHKLLKNIFNNVDQTGSSVDWIILNNILNNKWTSINLFGISFDDGSGISKSLALTTTIVAFINYIFNLFV